MKTSVEILDAARAALGGVSQYRLAKVCGVKPQYINDVTKGRTAIGAGLAVKLAEIIGCESAEIIAIAAMERAQDDQVRASWERLLERAGVAVLACVIFTSGGVGMMPVSAQAAAGFTAPGGGVSRLPVYTLCEVTQAANPSPAPNSARPGPEQCQTLLTCAGLAAHPKSVRHS